jgi:EpsD family peptidyl-prolyl cis-trans isomerase
MNLLSTNASGRNFRLLFIALLSATALLAGCGEHKKTATQVAAKVDKDEITIGQVNAMLAKMQVAPGKTEAQVKHEVLDNLIDQQLAMRQAISKKLDRDPVVMQAIEDTKRAILASAYMDRVRSAIAAVTPEDISKYYAAHPELFAQRRIFNLRELDVAVQPGVADSLRDQLAKGVALEAIAAGLKSKNIPFTGNASRHAAEETPTEILAKISTLKDGQMTLFEGKGALTILQVVATQAAPVDEKTASASIKQFLANGRSSEEITKELKSLRNVAKIEYLGDFAIDAVAHVEDKGNSKMDSANTPSGQHTPDLAKAVSNLK